MDPLPPRSRLGTTPPEIAQSDSEPDAPSLGLSVRLDRPYHELKEFLLTQFERAYITRCLSESEMNVSMASRTSGLSRKHLRTLMSKYGLRRDEALADDDEPTTDTDIPALPAPAV